MILRIHDKNYTTKIHTATSWYLVNDTSFNTYTTNAIASNELSSTDLLFWLIDVSSETSELFAIAIKHFDDNTTEKIGPVSVYDGQTNLVTYAVTDTKIETPFIFLNHNTFINGVGEISFRSSTIRPYAAVIGSVIWHVRDSITNKFIYREENVGSNYNLVLDNSKLDLSNLNRLEILCSHKGSNNVISGFGSFKQEVNVVDITMEGASNVSAELSYSPTFSSISATSITATSLDIFDDNKELIFSGLNDVPIGTLQFNETYSLVAIFDVIKDGSSFTSRKVFSIQTSSKDIRNNIEYGTETLIEYGTLSNAADKSISTILRNGDIVDTLPVNSQSLQIRDFATDTLRNSILVSPIGLTNEHVEVEIYSDVYSYVTNFNSLTNEIVIERFSLDVSSLFTRPAFVLTVQSESSNVAIRSHSEFLLIQNNALCSIDPLGVSTVLTTLPDASFDATSIEEYRVNLINDSELYVITNTNAILLINLITLDIDILNSFNRGSSKIFSTVTSSGGLLIADDVASHLYERIADTVTELVETVRSFIISSNRTIFKVL